MQPVELTGTILMHSQITCDLHMHTYYSDGRASPAEVLRHAASIGLTTVAITDHDNARGAREALPIAAQLGIELIPAIEFTCRWDDCVSPGEQEIDVLGYFVNLDDAEFQRIEQTALNDFHHRVADCCGLLTAAGYPLTLDEVYAENPRYAGALQFTFALRRKGHAHDWASSFDLFMPHWEQVRLCSFTIGQIIAAIHAAGGVAVLAHPVTVKCGGGWLQTDRVAALVEMGLDGLEIYHFRLDAEARAHFLALTRQFNLLVSGGSDEHGSRPGFPRMGSEPVTREMVEALRACSAERSNQI
jgi:predicted metal-dependent phosphoesterase TrpH